MANTNISIAESTKLLTGNDGYPGMSLTETINNGFFTVDDKWIIQYWNKAAEEIFGDKAVDMIGKNLWEKFAAILPLEFYAVYEKAFLPDIPVHFEEYWGEMGAWFNVITYYCDNTLSVSFKSSNHHSTYKEKPEKRLKILTEMYRLVTEVTNDCLWEWNLVAKEVFWIDGGHKRLFGYPIENALIPQSFWEKRIHPDDKVRIMGELNKLIASKPGGVWEEEYRFQKSSGEYAWVHDRGHIIYEEGQATRMIGATQDITARKSAELQLLDSERKLSIIAKHMSNAVIITDAVGKITWTNPAFTHFTGYNAKEVAGRKAGSFLYGEETDRSTAEYITYKMRAMEPYECNIINYTKSGRVYWNHIQGQPIFDNAGKLVQYFSIATDINEKMLLENRLAQERKIKQLEITSALISAREHELEEIGKKLYDDVNQVLVAVKLFIELAKTNKPKRDMYLEKSVDSIIGVIGEISKISQYLIPEGMYHSVFDSIDLLVDDLNSSGRMKLYFFREGINKVDISPNLQLNIFRIVQEQLTNIIKHAAATEVRIKLSHDKDNYNNEVVLQISDNGKGCDINEKRKAAGIRNIISRAEFFNGKVAIVSQPGNGFHLKVMLPIDHVPVEY
jgi:PAS domain S-box-containing protein